jgi:hypothetical protein
MSQVVLLAQLPRVNVGAVNASFLLLAVTAAVTVPGSAEDARAVILKCTVPPGWTVLPEAVTVTVGFVGGGGVGVPVGVGVAVGVAVGDAVGGAGGVVDAGGVLGALAEVVAVGVLDALVEAEALTALGVAVVEVDGFAVVDGVAVGVAARAVVVMPLEMTKMPVAKPIVTGRECADRIRTPCLCLLSPLGTCSSAWCFRLGTSVRSLWVHRLPFGYGPSYSTPRRLFAATPGPG